MYLPNLPPRTRCDTRLLFFRACLPWFEFRVYFLDRLSYQNKNKNVEPTLMARREQQRISFARTLEQKEIETASSKILTRVAVHFP